MEQNDRTYIAHSANSHGVIQTMKEHCSGVSHFMEEFALSESFTELYRFCGLIHDMGKYSDEFQRHIAGENNHVKHSIFGAKYAFDSRNIEIALPVYGHHAGMPDVPYMCQEIKTIQNEIEKYDKICEAWMSDFSSHMPNDKLFHELPDFLQKELFVRMLYSALVDADSLDTERHFSDSKSAVRKSLPFEPDKLLLKLQKELHHLESVPTKEINRLRNDVRLFAESKANLPQGCFSLTLPTGLGKTICSINWALHHAKYHSNIKRIIIVLPFISIIDQTADKLKGIFNVDGDYVLEHHSSMIYFENEDTDEYNPKQLATENWDYPIIITTSVQFFESLFSNSRSKCRKLHNIQDSIIIFDEIQTLPLEVTEPSLIMLDNLQQLCRCSILFCTATQPDFQTRNGFNGIKHIESLVDKPEDIFNKARRVTYHPINDYKEIPMSDLADLVIRNRKSALVVFNTKKKARAFCDELSGNDSYRLFHLSTTMCPVHRKEVIKSIRKALANKESIIVSSTQLIEAGVDMDFPTVYRELAPLESIIQSAGRCNREGQDITGDVYLFKLIEQGQPSKEYRSFLEFANLLYKGNEEKLYTHDFYSYYYREYVRNFGDTDKQHITEDRKKLLYQTVAEKYRIIDNKTQTLFVYDYNNDSKQLYYQVKDKEYLSRQEQLHIAQFCVQVYDNFIENNRSFIGNEQCGLLVWHGTYSLDYGLPFNDEISILIK